MPAVARAPVSLTADGVVVADVRVAATATERRRGLLGKDQLDAAMWFPGVRSVHTVGMRIPIDVAHVDARGVVLATRTMVPNRIGRWRRAAGILEAEAGAFVRWRIEVGTRIGVGVWPEN